MTEVLDGVVVEALPQRLYRVRVDEGAEIVAGLSPQAQRTGLALRVGQAVRVQRARLDPGRGLILGPLEAPESPPGPTASGEDGSPRTRRLAKKAPPGG